LFGAGAVLLLGMLGGRPPQVNGREDFPRAGMLAVDIFSEALRDVAGPLHSSIRPCGAKGRAVDLLGPLGCLKPCKRGSFPFSALLPKRPSQKRRASSPRRSTSDKKKSGEKENALAFLKAARAAFERVLRIREWTPFRCCTVELGENKGRCPTSPS